MADIYYLAASIVAFIAGSFGIYKISKEPKREKIEFFIFLLVFCFCITALSSGYFFITKHNMSIQMEREQTQNEINSLNSKIENLESKSDILTKNHELDIAKLERTIDSLERIPKRSQKEIDQIIKKINDKKDALEVQYLDELNQLINEKSQLIEQVENLKSELESMRNKYNFIEKELMSTKNRLAESNQQVDSLEAEVEALNKYIREETISKQSLASFNAAEDKRKEAQALLMKGKKNDAFSSYEDAIVLYQDVINKQKYGTSEEILKYIKYCIKGLDRIDPDKRSRNYEKYDDTIK